MYHSKQKETFATVVLLAAVGSLLTYTFVAVPNTPKAQGLQLVKRWLCQAGYAGPTRASNGVLDYWYYQGWCSIYYNPYGAGQYTEYEDTYWDISYAGFLGPWFYCCHFVSYLGYVNYGVA